MELEHPFVRAPYEAFSKFIQGSQKVYESEVKAIGVEIDKAVASLAKSSAAAAGRKDKDGEKKENEGTAAALKTLAALSTRVKAAKKKLDDAEKQAAKWIERCKVRLDYLHSVEQNQDDPVVVEAATQSRLDRLMVDYLLRQGYSATANLLATEANMVPLVDLEVFVSAKNVVDGLKAHDCSKALAWCLANKAKLKRINSSLEFKLLRQEFLEKVRSGNVTDAVSYAQKFFAPFAENNMQEIQRLMTVLAFLKTPSVWEKYRAYFAESPWDELIALFRREQLILNGMTEHSMLDLMVQAGLSTLKTPVCGIPDHINHNCPVCSPLFSELAKSLPFTQRMHSCIVCRISGVVMDEHNPPLALPNGNVYSRNALTAMAAANDGIITCPRTQDKFPLSACKSVYIL